MRMVDDGMMVVVLVLTVAMAMMTMVRMAPLGSH